MPHHRLIIAVATALLSTAALAQTYPVKPIRMIVPYSPGGGADTSARIVARRLGETLGQPVVVENRTGGGGAIGAEFVAKSAPDGYTLLFDASGIVINTAARKLPFDLQRELTPVSLVVTAPMVLVTPPDAPYKTVTEFVQYAKASANPVAIASSGAGSAQHFAAELLSATAGFPMLHVPYKGGAPAMTDVMGGQVGAYFANVASASGHLKAGKLRALGVTSAQRVATLPDVPTIAQSGVSGYNVAEWNAVFVPSKTPDAIVQRLATEIASAVRQPDVRQSLEQLGLEPVGNTPEQFAGFVRDEIAKWTVLIKTNKIELQ
jgi:tripartite-type tricarboxylate transporter receptor subunit TctC